jgi:hypothetical protein
MNSKTVNLEKIVNQLIAHRRAGVAPPSLFWRAFARLQNSKTGRMEKFRQ